MGALWSLSCCAALRDAVLGTGRRAMLWQAVVSSSDFAEAIHEEEASQVGGNLAEEHGAWSKATPRRE